MTNNHDTDPENSAARIADDIANAQKQNRNGAGRPSLNGRVLPAIVMIVAAAGVIAFMYWPKEDEDSLSTASPEQFQTDSGDPFGQLGRPVREPPPPAEPDPELLQQIADLKAQLEALRNQPPETVEVEDNSNDEQLEQLLTQISELQTSLNQAQENNRRALEDRDRQLARLQADLDAARLSGNGDTATLDNGEDLYQQRINSPMVAFSLTGDTSGDTAGADTNAGRKMSDNELFAREAAKAVTVEQSQIIANPSNTVMQGTMIQAALETAINTDLPGAIRAVTTEDVHSFDGTRILIPRGSHVIGAYSDNIVLGQRRAMVIWNRIIMPDNQTVNIGAYGGDAIGRSGMDGKVDTHFAERFGSAALISMITLAPALLIDDDSDDDNGSDIADAMSQSLSGAMGNTLSAYLDRKPTIGIDQGSEVTIMVDRDLEIF